MAARVPRDREDSPLGGPLTITTNPQGSREIERRVFTFNGAETPKSASASSVSHLLGQRPDFGGLECAVYTSSVGLGVSVLRFTDTCSLFVDESYCKGSAFGFCSIYSRF